MTKTERQSIGAERWKANKGVGTLQYPMRFGKTFAGLMIALRVLSSNPNRTVIIGVPSDIIRTTWKNDMVKFNNIYNNELDINRIRVLTRNQLIYMDAICTLFILDEIHSFLSEEAKKLFTTIKYQFILGLTGTYPSGKDKKFLDKHCPVVDYLSKTEALENGWIAESVQYNIPLLLPEFDVIKYIRHSEPIANTLASFKDKHLLFNTGSGTLYRDDYDLIQACVRGKVTKLSKEGRIRSENVRRALSLALGWTPTLDLHNEQNLSLHSKWSPESIHDITSQFVDHVKYRNDLINNHPYKCDAVVKAYKANHVSTICFTESIELADRIRDAINKEFPGEAVSYHNSTESKPLIDPKTGEYFTKKDGTIKKFGKILLKKDAIEGIQNGTYKMLVTVKALDQGMDSPTLQQVFITGGSLDPIPYQQRSARASTIDIHNLNKVATIVNFYFDDMSNDEYNEVVISRDKTKLKKRQENNKSEIIWLNNLDEFINEFI